MSDRITFYPTKGKPREGTIAPGFVTEDKVKVLLDGDPFPVDVPKSQISACQKDSDPVGSSAKVPKSGTKKIKKGKKKTMTTDSKPSGKELRKQAQALGIKGWEDMGRKELTKAIKKASKSKAEKTEAPEPVEKPKATPAKKAAPKKTTKTPAKKAATPAKKAAVTKSTKTTKAAPKKAVKKVAPKSKAPSKPKREISGDASIGITLPKGKTPKKLPAEGENPFRPNSNLHLCAKLLLKGGKRKTLAESLAKKVKLNPYVYDAKDVDLGDYDKRLILAAGTMRDQYGYGVQRVGRGLEGKVLVFVPGGPNDPRGKATPKGKAAAKKR